MGGSGVIISLHRGNAVAITDTGWREPLAAIAGLEIAVSTIQKCYVG
jgi:hypothetical protein